MPRHKIKAAQSSTKARKTSKKRGGKRSTTKAGAKTVALPKVSSAAAKPAKVTEPDRSITIQTQGGKFFSIQSSPELRRAAMQWSYVLRYRNRWNSSESDRKELSQRCQEQMITLGLTKSDLAQLAESEIIEVRVPFNAQKDTWEARVFPWEHILSAATRAFRRGRPVTVVRHLDRMKPSKTHSRKPDSLLFIESAPDELRKRYEFEAERDLVTSNLDLNSSELIIDRAKEEVRAKIERMRPAIIHLTGFDINQAIYLNALPEQQVHDGYLMLNSMGQPEAVEADELAGILNAASEKPALVSCNIFHSGALICSLIVAGGASASIGFQDEFDDALIELFFASFYSNWQRFNWDLLEAFRYACDAVKSQPQGLMGTGIILWSERSLVKPQSRASAIIEKGLLTEKSQPIRIEQLAHKDIRDLIKTEIKACENLNYSMLHNNCPLFEKFTLTKKAPGRVNSIEVEVILYVGERSFSYRGTEDMADPVLDLRESIRVPLLYSLDLLNKENIHTALFVEVKWAGQVLHRQTYRVTLPPLDEWRDNDTDRLWLPSFVLPRDPAVDKLMDIALNYLRALRDDIGAGFDGYQSINLTDQENPYFDVDQQVKSLWSALLYNIRPAYINPPPTYYLVSQRLRTPTEIISSRRGTCIDLALLLASCLEYIDIYPVIFLLKGHAFPGYWRSSQHHEKFRQVNTVFQSTAADSVQKSEASTIQKWPWFHKADAYEEIMLQVENGSLMPIETVFLTRGFRFQDALDDAYQTLQASANLKDGEPRKFEAMIDIVQARTSQITPIPRD
jgi:hypothetical protein